MEKKYIVTLELTTDTNPAHWDWPNVLDLPDREHVKVKSVGWLDDVPDGDWVEPASDHASCTDKWCEEAHEPNSRCPKNNL